MHWFEIDCVQGSYEWHLARAGCLTASRAATIMTGSPEVKSRYAYELVGDMLAAKIGKLRKTFFGEAMEWGKCWEPVARENYKWDVADVEEVGFLIHTEINKVGCSPDGIWMNDIGLIERGLEIKCPFTPEMHEKHISGLISPLYYWQCQFSMWLTGAAFWDFMSFDPRRESQKTYYKRFVRENSIMNQISQAVAEFVDVRDNLSSFEPKPSAAELLLSGALPKFDKLKTI